MPPPPVPASRSDRDRRLQLQRLLTELMARFAVMPPNQVDDTIVAAQRLIVEALGLDRSTLWQFEPETDSLLLTHGWQRPEWPPLPPRLDAASLLPWAHEKVLRGESFHFHSVDDLPPEAARDIESFRTHGPKSNLTVPLSAHGKVFGALAFATLKKERRWHPDEREELKLVAQIVGQVLAEQRAEKRARQLHHELAHSARAAALGELAAALAHELDQPLSAILTNAQSALRFLAQDNLDPEELRATLEDIVRDNRRASGLIHNLRAMLSRTPVAHEPCSLNDLIPEVVTFFHSQWIEPGIALHLDLAPDVPPVHVARVEVQQVLVNLLLNATQALEDAPEPHRRVLVATRREPGRIVVRVADEGPGIPETLLEQVFAPFYTTKSSGLGMGLAISRRLIEENGGTLAAHRNHPRGSVFEFRLPTAPAA